MVCVKNSFTIVFVAMTISLTACGNKTSITFTDPTETSESNITRFDKKLPENLLKL